MHLTIRRTRRAVPARETSERSPRTGAIAWLREKIAAGEAGRDPYDPAIFIVTAHSYERVWGARAFGLAGAILVRLDRPDGGLRLCGVLESDVRLELGLDGPDAPLMTDEPLASRGVDAASVATDAVELSPRPPLYSVPGDGADLSEGMLALQVARAAYDRRYPEGVQR